MRRVWYCVILVFLGLAPLVISRGLTGKACCCTAVSAQAECHCGEEPSSPPCDCSLENAPDFPADLAVSTSVPNNHEECVVLVVHQILVALLRIPRQERDGQRKLSAGWVLPSSPPERVKGSETITAGI